MSHLRFGNRNGGLGRLSFRAWQRWLSDRPLVKDALGIPAKAASSVAAAAATFAAQSPVKALVADRVAMLVGNMTYFGENVAQKAGEIAGAGVVVAGVALGYAAWKAIDRYRHRNDPPEPDPAEKLEEVEKSATKANEQATRANTRLDVANNRFDGLEAKDSDHDQRLAHLESLVGQLVSHAQTRDQQIGALQLENQQLRQQVQAVGQQASTADARAVLAQSEVQDVQASQLLQDGRLDAMTNELQQRTTGTTPQPQNPPASEPLPDDLAARTRALEERSLRLRAAAGGRQPQPTQPQPNQPRPGLRPHNPQPRQDPHRPSR